MGLRAMVRCVRISATKKTSRVMLITSHGKLSKAGANGFDSGKYSTASRSRQSKRERLLIWSGNDNKNHNRRN
jgi:hypothetical protein